MKLIKTASSKQINQAEVIHEEISNKKRRMLKKSKIKEKLLQIQGYARARNVTGFYHQAKNLSEENNDELLNNFKAGSSQRQKRVIVNQTKLSKNVEFEYQNKIEADFESDMMQQKQRYLELQQQLNQFAQERFYKKESSFKLISQEENRQSVSVSALPQIDLGENAHQQSLAAQKLLGLGWKRSGAENSQRSNQKDQPEARISTLTKSIETSMDVVGRGSSIARTVVIKRDASKDKIPIWAANALRACESPKLTQEANQNQVGNNEHQVLEKVYKNGKVQYKVFSMQQKPRQAVDITKSNSDKNHVQVFQADVIQKMLLKQDRPTNKEGQNRNAFQKDQTIKSIYQQKKEKTQLNKTKTFAQNLMEMLEGQTKNSIEVRKATSQDKNNQSKPASNNLRSQLETTGCELVENNSQKRNSTQGSMQRAGKIGLHGILLSGLEPKKNFTPVQLSPKTKEAVLKLTNAQKQGPFAPPKKPKILPPVEGVFSAYSGHERVAKQIDLVDIQSISSDSILERRNTEDNQISRNLQERRRSQGDFIFSDKQIDTQIRQLPSQYSSKELESTDKNKSNFAITYEAAKSKQSISSNVSKSKLVMLKSSEQYLNELQKCQQKRLDAVIQAHSKVNLNSQDHFNKINNGFQTSQLQLDRLGEPLQSSSSTRTALIQHRGPNQK